MATAFITFFLITRLYVYKMDADCRKRRRIISNREKRWSMNSQRLEKIVAELMKPISDARRSFDTDLSALLEEYLTEAGLHALDAEEEINTVIPNFTEVALLLQQSVSIYSRKVDFLYQHVLNVSDSLHNNTQELEQEPAAEAGAGGAAGAGARRKRKASVREFELLELVGGAGARREGGVGRAPPTLPRVYVDLEPRVLGARDFPLRDYAGEPVGLLADFHAAWRLHRGQLVEELAEGCDSGPAPRALPLCELQAAIAAAFAAAAPPSPPPALDPSPDPASPDLASPDPASPDLASPDPASPDLAVVQKKERKRRSNLISDVDISDCAKNFHVSQEARAQLARPQEFSVPRRWRARVLAARCADLRALRRRLRHRRLRGDFRGFHLADQRDIGGFAGWSPLEVTVATAATVASAARREESDDDGFFERSSLGDSDTSRADDPAATALTSLPGAPEWEAWRARVLARAAAGAGAGGAVLRACGAVLRAAPPPPAAAPFPALLARTAAAPADVSKVFLATLFLANAGNVEILPGAPLQPGAFSVRVLSADEGLYRRAMH